MRTFCATTRPLLRQRSPPEALSAAVEAMACPSQPALSRLVNRLSCEENPDVLEEGVLASGLRRVREKCRRSADFPVVDGNDVPFPGDGHQPGNQYCGHVGHRCYSAPVAVSGECGDILGLRPRRQGEDKAGETVDFVLPIVAGALEEGDERPVLVRMDAGVPDGRALDEFDSPIVRYLARIRNNPVRNRMAEPFRRKRESAHPPRRPAWPQSGAGARTPRKRHCLRHNLAPQRTPAADAPEIVTGYSRGILAIRVASRGMPAGLHGSVSPAILVPAMWRCSDGWRPETRRAARPAFFVGQRAIAMHLVAKTELDRRIAACVAPTARELGLELVRVRAHESKEPSIQIMAERQEGSIDLDDCARLSRAIRPLLDELSPGRNFTLEVSSPGIDRPLTRLEDFAGFAGSPARIEMTESHSGRRRFRGTLLGLRSAQDSGEENGAGTEAPEPGPWIAILDENAGEVLLPFAAVSAARLAPGRGSDRRHPATRKNRKH